MGKRFSVCAVFVATLLWLFPSAPQEARTARRLDPIVYTIKVSAPDMHIAEVEASIPTEKRATIDLMMALWSPGFYRAESYASRVTALSARTPDGKALAVEQ